MEKIETSITVIVPVHNSEKTIEAVLGPLRKELLNGDQLIVVDDRSDDRSGETASRCGASVISSSGSPGAAGARNTGAYAAAGEWVLFVDSDAVAPPGWRDKLQDRIDQGSAAVQATYSPVAAGKNAATFYKNFYYYYTFTKRIRSDYNRRGCGFCRKACGRRGQHSHGARNRGLPSEGILLFGLDEVRLEHDEIQSPVPSSKKQRSCCSVCFNGNSS